MTIQFPYARRDDRVRNATVDWTVQSNDPTFLPQDLSCRVLEETLPPDWKEVKTAVMNLRLVSRRWRHEVEDYFQFKAPLPLAIKMGEHYCTRISSRDERPIPKTMIMAQCGQRFRYLDLKAIKEMSDVNFLLQTPGWQLADLGSIGIDDISRLRPLPGMRGRTMRLTTQEKGDSSQEKLFPLLCLPDIALDLTWSGSIDRSNYLAKELARLIEEEWPAGGKICFRCQADLDSGTSLFSTDVGRELVTRLAKIPGCAREIDGDSPLRLSFVLPAGNKQVVFEFLPVEGFELWLEHGWFRDIMPAGWLGENSLKHVTRLIARIFPAEGEEFIRLLSMGSDLRCVELFLHALAGVPGFGNALLDALAKHKRIKQLGLMGLSNLDREDAIKLAEVLHGAPKLKALCLGGTGLRIDEPFLEWLKQSALKELKVDADLMSSRFMHKLAAVVPDTRLEAIRLGKVLPGELLMMATEFERPMEGDDGDDQDSTSIELIFSLAGDFPSPVFTETIELGTDDNRRIMLEVVASHYQIPVDELEVFFSDPANEQSIPAARPLG